MESPAIYINTLNTGQMTWLHGATGIISLADTAGEGYVIMAS